MFKVGDKVRVKRDADTRWVYWVMSDYIGTEGVVTGFSRNYPEYPTVGFSDGSAYFFKPEMIEPATDDPLQAIRDAVAKAAATASPAQVISAASALGLRVEQQTTYVLKGA